MSLGEVAEVQSDDALEPAEIHDVLRNDRRRRVIEQLRTTGHTESVRDLAEHIASIEADETPPPRNIRQSVYVSLHQTHLPKLDELGIVTYHSDAKEVELAGNVDEVAVYMEVVPKYGLSWGEYYLSIGVLGLLTLVGDVVGIPVLSTVDPAMLGGVFLLLVTLSGVYQIADQRSSLLHRVRELSSDGSESTSSADSTESAD